MRRRRLRRPRLVPCQRWEALAQTAVLHDDSDSGGRRCPGGLTTCALIMQFGTPGKAGSVLTEPLTSSFFFTLWPVFPLPLVTSLLLRHQNASPSSFTGASRVLSAQLPRGCGSNLLISRQKCRCYPHGVSCGLSQARSCPEHPDLCLAQQTVNDRNHARTRSHAGVPACPSAIHAAQINPAQTALCLNTDDQQNRSAARTGLAGSCQGTPGISRHFGHTEQEKHRLNMPGYQEHRGTREIPGDGAGEGYLCSGNSLCSHCPGTVT